MTSNEELLSWEQGTETITVFLSRKGWLFFKWLWLKLRGRHIIAGRDLDRFREALLEHKKEGNIVLKVIINGKYWFINKNASLEKFNKLPDITRQYLKEQGYFTGA